MCSWSCWFWGGNRGRTCGCPFLKKRFYLFIFIERGEGRENERERNINVWLPVTCPLWGPSLQPRHVPWLGIKLVTLWFTGQHSIHWATPARAIGCPIDKSLPLKENWAWTLQVCSLITATGMQWDKQGIPSSSHLDLTQDLTVLESKLSRDNTQLGSLGP